MSNYPGTDISVSPDDPGDIGGARMGEDAYGQYVIAEARVILYPVGNEWEVDILVPGIDGAVGFDVPRSAIKGKGAVWETFVGRAPFAAEIPIEVTAGRSSTRPNPPAFRLTGDAALDLAFLLFEASMPAVMPNNGYEAWKDGLATRLGAFFAEKEAEAEGTRARRRPL